MATRIKQVKSNTPTSRRVKENGYSHAKADARDARKRSEAEARQVAHDARDLDTKIARAKLRRGESKRELARLGVAS